MAKRFFNTQRIEEDWYLNLSCKHRELLRYCESKCDQAGVFNFNPKIATSYIGEKVDESDIEKLPIKKLDNGRYWIVDFVPEQVGELSESCPAHKPILKSIKENNLNTLLDTLSNTLFNRVLEKEKEEDKEKEEEKEKEKDKEKEKEKREEKIIFPFNTEKFRIAWGAWKQYKKEQHKFTYKGEHSEQIALKELSEKSNHNETTAINIIQQSIANGWKGLFQLKNNINGQIRNQDGTINWKEVNRNADEFLSKQGLGRKEDNV